MLKLMYRLNIRYLGILYNVLKTCVGIEIKTAELIAATEDVDSAP